MPDTKVTVTMLDMTDGAAVLQPDNWLYVQRWFLARKGLNHPPQEIEAPNGVYRLAGEHGHDGYLYEPVKRG